MAIELKIPEVGESITEVEIGGWLKNKGDAVQKDEPVVTLESEKATVELPAPDSGTIGEVLKKKGEVAKVGEVIGYLELDGRAGATTRAEAKKAPEAKPEKASESKSEKSSETKTPEPRVMPAAERVLAERHLKAEQVQGSGPGGRILKQDVEGLVPAKEQAEPLSEAAQPPTPQKAEA